MKSKMDYNSKKILNEAAIIAKDMQASDNIFIKNIGKQLALMDINDILRFRIQWAKLWHKYWIKNN